MAKTMKSTLLEAYHESLINKNPKILQTLHDEGVSLEEIMTLKLGVQAGNKNIAIPRSKNSVDFYSYENGWVEVVSEIKKALSLNNGDIEDQAITLSPNRI